MKEKKKKRPPRTRSIARKINLSFFFDLFWIFLFLDVLVIGFELWPFLMKLNSGEINAEIVILRLNHIIEKPVYITVAAAEGFFLLTQLLLGAGNIRRSLRPLDEIASAAINFDEKVTGIDEEAFRRLEDAIDNIDSASDKGRIQTGEKELEGLELAVNNLIRRMRESYLQQARFVSDASHELRTPIAVIKGYADMLDRWGKTDEKVLEESIEAIKSESEHMNHLVEQLLFLARGDTGRAKMEFSDFDLAALLHEVYDEYSMIDSAHKFTIEAAGPIPLYGDQSMIKQTARILIDNAIKYTPQGGSIAIRARGYFAGASFSVQDSGIGISEAAAPHIFERFYRADSSRTRETGGTGLGLSIAKWIVDKHKGSFDIVSREEVGTRISVTLPRLPHETAKPGGAENTDNTQPRQ